MRHRNGAWRHVEGIYTNLLDDPYVGGLVMNTRDVTQRKEAERGLARLAALPEQDPNQIIEMDLDGHLTYANPAAGRLFPDLRDLGKDHPILAGIDPASVRARAAEGAPVDEVRVGELSYHRSVSYTPSSGRVRVYAMDATEGKKIEDQSARSALRDPVTGLPNKALFVDRAGHALERAGRTRDQVATLLLHLNGSEDVRSSPDPEAGDRLLAGVAERIARAARPGDTVARIVGDEFAVLMENLMDVEEALAVASRISEGLKTPFSLPEAPAEGVSVTASVGISIGSPGRTSPEVLLREAGVAARDAQRTGAGTAVYEESMLAETTARPPFENDLRRAVASGGEEFELHYQPKLDLETGAVAGVEALVRWNHPERGLLPPGEFIPLAEETGLIPPLRDWVLGEACQQAREWRDEGAGDRPTVSVNLSARQFVEPSLVEKVSGALARNGLEGEALTLEITETVMTASGDPLIEKLGQLKALGVKLAMDDFGAGQTSAYHMRRFPMDYLEISRSFVAALGEDNPESETAISGIVDLAHSLGVTTVAEGVETEAQLAKLRTLG